MQYESSSFLIGFALCLDARELESRDTRGIRVGVFATKRAAAGLNACAMIVDSPDHAGGQELNGTRNDDVETREPRWAILQYYRAE